MIDDNSPSIEDQVAIDCCQQILFKELEKYVGTVPHPEDVKQVLIDTIQNLTERNIICSGDTKNVKVEQLWKSWSFKKKLKWFVHNKFPLLKDASEEVRKAIDSFNELRFATEEFDGYYMPMEYPEHLQPHPKRIYVTHMDLKLNAGIEYINVDITIGDKND